MIKTTRQMLREVIADTYRGHDITDFSSDQMKLVVARLDASQDWVVDRMLEKSPYMFSTSYDLTLTGAERYYLPDSLNWDYCNILMVTNITDSATEPTKTISTIWGDYLNYYDGTIQTEVEPYNIRDEYIEFPLQPSTGTMRIWYVRRPKGFFYCTASSGTTTTAVVPTSMTAGELVLKDDYYIGMKLAVGTEVSRITDFDAYTTASTHTFTVTPAYYSAVSSSTVVELVSPLPDRALQLIVDKTIERMKIGDDDPVDQIFRSVNDDALSISTNISNSQRTGIRYIKKVGRNQNY